MPVPLIQVVSGTGNIRDACKSSACDGVFKSKRLHIARNMFTLVNDSCQILEFRVVIYKDESAFLAILESIIHLKGFNVYDFVFYIFTILCFTEIDVFFMKWMSFCK